MRYEALHPLVEDILNQLSEKIGVNTLFRALLDAPGATLAWKRGTRRRSICCDHNHFTARSRLWQRLRARTARSGKCPDRRQGQ